MKVYGTFETEDMDITYSGNQILDSYGVRGSEFTAVVDIEVEDVYIMDEWVDFNSLPKDLQSKLSDLGDEVENWGIEG